MSPAHRAAIRWRTSRRSAASSSLYNPELLAKPQLVAANKIDALDDPKRVTALEKRAKKLKLTFFQISAVTGEGVKALIEAAWPIIAKAREIEVKATRAGADRNEDAEPRAGGLQSGARRAAARRASKTEAGRKTDVDEAGCPRRHFRSDPQRPCRGRGCRRNRRSTSIPITLIPSHVPPHRQDPVGATSEQRYEMARWLRPTSRMVGVAHRARPRRARRIPTTRSASSSQPRASGGASAVTSRRFFFITGADAFAEIATWSRYPAVLDLANFVVVSRPGITLDSLRARVPSAFRVGHQRSTRVILVEATHSRHLVDRHSAARPRRPQPLRFRAGSRRPLHRGASSLLWTLDCMAKTTSQRKPRTRLRQGSGEARPKAAATPRLPKAIRSRSKRRKTRRRAASWCST